MRFEGYRRWAALVGGVVLALTGWLAAGTARADCRMQGLAEIKVVVRHGRILIPSEVNGHKAFFILDTGSDWSFLAQDAAVRLGLATHNLRGVHAYGIGGEMQLRAATIDRLALGQFTLTGAEIPVGDALFGDEPEVVGLVGLDLFQRWDLELDLAHSAVKVVKSTGCSDDQMVYWGAAYVQAPLIERGGNDLRDYVQVKLDNVPIEALMDTGAPRSTVTLAGAARAGVRPNSPGVVEVGVLGGMGRARTPLWVGTFQTFDLAGEKITNVKIGMADLFSREAQVELGSRLPVVFDAPQMLLGLDFFMAHRMLISRSHHAVFICYQGGPVFDLRAEQARLFEATPQPPAPPAVGTKPPPGATSH